MSGEAVTITLSREEWALVAALRDLPESRARELATQIIRELLEAAREPRCAQMQADGVPCPTAANDCAECRQLEAALDALRRAPAGSARRPPGSASP